MQFSRPRITPFSAIIPREGAAEREKTRLVPGKREITREHYRETRSRSMNSRSSYRIPGLARISIIYTLLAGNSHRVISRGRPRRPAPFQGAENPNGERFAPPNFPSATHDLFRRFGEMVKKGGRRRSLTRAPSRFVGITYKLLVRSSLLPALLFSLCFDVSFASARADYRLFSADSPSRELFTRPPNETRPARHRCCCPPLSWYFAAKRGVFGNQTADKRSDCEFYLVGDNLIFSISWYEWTSE